MFKGSRYEHQQSSIRYLLYLHVIWPDLNWQHQVSDLALQKNQGSTSIDRKMLLYHLHLHQDSRFFISSFAEINFEIKVALKATIFQPLRGHFQVNKISKLLVV